MTCKLNYLVRTAKNNYGNAILPGMYGSFENARPHVITIDDTYLCEIITGLQIVPYSSHFSYIHLFDKWASSIK